MNSHLTRQLRSVRAAAAIACTTVLVALPGTANATSTHSTDDFDFDADGLCAFTVHLTVHNDTDTTRQATADGSIVIDQTIETATVSANGVTIHGLPYHYTVRRTLDASGNDLTAIAPGGEWRFPLPDGSVWSAGGRLDFFTGEVVGSWSFEDGLGPVCDALGG